jgi:1,4-alpha-glucan branching enzyme
MKLKNIKSSVGQVHFEFNHPTAKTVFIAGTFNQWCPDAIPMRAIGAGRWAKDLSLPPGTYEYRLIVDGEWISDPSAARTRANPFGSANSILLVPDLTDAPKRLSAPVALRRWGEQPEVTPTATRPASSDVSVRQ